MGLSHSNQLSYWAAREGRSDDLVYHLREGGREVCLYRDKKGNTCLHAAAEGGHVACINVLLTAGMHCLGGWSLIRWCVNGCTHGTVVSYMSNLSRLTHGMVK